MLPSGISRFDPRNGLLIPDMREPSLKQFLLVKECRSNRKKSIALRIKNSGVRLNAGIGHFFCKGRE